MAEYLPLKIAENVAVGMEGVAAYLRGRKCSTDCGELEPQPSNVIEACKRLRNRRWSDSIYEVYKPTGAEPEVDLLFFHDLHEACEPFPHFSTWTSSATSPEVVVWPGTWIPEMFPLARVLIWTCSEEFSSFLQRYPDCQVCTFRGRRETMLRLKHFKQPTLLVPEASIMRGIIFGFDQDHVTICKPNSRSSHSFCRLTTFIRECQELEISRKRNPVWKSEAGLEHVYFGFRLQCSRDSTLSANFVHKVQDKLRTKLTAHLNIVVENFSCSDNLVVIRHAGHEVLILCEVPHHIDILVRTVHSSRAAQFVKRHIIEEIKSLNQSEDDYPHKQRSLGLGFFRKECVKQVFTHELTRNSLGPRFSRECVQEVFTHELRGKQAVVLVKDLEESFRRAINENCKSISPKLWRDDEDLLRGIVFHTWPSMENNQRQVLLPCTHESVFELLRQADPEALSWIVAEICTTHESIKDATIQRKSDQLYELHNVGDPNMTIIFFHGFCRTPDEADSIHLSTWITQSEEFTEPWAHLWPKTWLAGTFPRARMFTAKYDTSLEVTSTGGRLDLYALGEQLVKSIIDLPQCEPGISELPVVLVGHCIGGIIMERFLLSAYQTRGSDSPENKRERFLKNVGLLFYYSTPHKGLNVLTTTANDKSPMFEVATLFNKEVARLHQDLNRIPADVRKCRVAAVGATLPTNWPSVGIDDILVEEGSSRQGDYVSVNKDHFSICRPESRTSNAFLHLVNSIKSTIYVQ